MTVHMAGTMPADELNGLIAIESALIGGHLAGAKHLVVGVVEVSGTKAQKKDGFATQPIVSFTQIESVPEEMHGKVLDLLQTLRSARSGKTTLDFPAEENEPVVPVPLELTTLEESYTFEVVDSAPGKFDLIVHAPSGAEALRRHQLLRSVYGELPPGVYTLLQLEADEALDELSTLAVRLVRDYESGFTSTDADDTVYAEVVDDEAEDA